MRTRKCEGEGINTFDILLNGRKEVISSLDDLCETIDSYDTYHNDEAENVCSILAELSEKDKDDDVFAWLSGNNSRENDLRNNELDDIILFIDRNEGELMGLANESRCRADEATAQQILGNSINKGDYSLISPLLSGIEWGTSKNNDNPKYRKESPKDDINKENVTNFLQSLKNDMRAISNLNEVGFRRLANRLGSSNLNQAEKCIVMFAIGRALASWILDEKSDKTSMEGRRCRGRRCLDDEEMSEGRRCRGRRCLDDDEEMNEAKKGGRIGLQHNIKFI